MVKIHPHLDEHGFRRAGAPPGYDVLANFLESDVHGCAFCDELLALIEGLQRGQTTPWEGTGNAFTLTLTAQGATLECEYSEPLRCNLPLADLRSALETWRDFIRANGK